MENSGQRWVKKVRRALKRLSKFENAPTLDIRWLILRCNDTINYPADIQEASILQLVKDLAVLERKFPGHMSDLLRGPDAQ